MTPTTDTDFRILPLAQLHESPLNPRRHFNAEALAELAASVMAHGILTPLLVRPNATGFEIGAGHRRYRAAKLAGLAACPAVVRPMDDAAFLELLNIENLLREDVHPLEEAQGYKTLMTAGSYTVERLADRVGKSAKYIYDRIKLLALTKPAQQLFWDGKITAGHAILLARLTPADQARVIGEEDAHGNRTGGLFQPEHLLWGPDEDPPDDQGKAVSVRELQAWIDRHVKFDAATADPRLFPETTGAIAAAKDEAEKVVSITHESYVQPEARDGQRVIGPRSWKRADGRTQADKPCAHAITGVVVIGPGRGEAFRVCVAKEKCAVHWATEQREKAKRATSLSRSSGGAEKGWERDQRRREEQRQREEAEQQRFDKAAPAILKAVAGAVRKASARAGGLLGAIVLEACTARFGRPMKDDPAGFVPRGSSAEDLVRHAAFVVLAGEIAEWHSAQRFPKRAKAFGIDVRRLVDASTPAPTAAPSEESGSTAKKGSVTKTPTAKRARRA